MALTGKLLAYVERHPGNGIEKIGAGIGVSTRDLQIPVRRLLAARKIRTRGAKRATRYY